MTPREQNDDAGGMPVLTISGVCEMRVWGLSTEERFRRLARGVQAGHLILPAEWVFDRAALQALADKPNTILLAQAEPGGPLFAAGAHLERGTPSEAVESLLGKPAPHPADLEAAGLTPIELSRAGRYDPKMKKLIPPFAGSLDFTPVRQVERTLYDGAYKGVTDLVTKYVWPKPARAVTGWCARAGVKPNTVTFISLVLTLAALGLFAIGAYAPGLVCAWGMTFLDTVDGKLARVTLTSSKWGDKFDHGIDLVSPPFWYAVWWQGLPPELRGADPVVLALIVTLAGYVAGRLIEGAFILMGGFHIHIWKRFDSAFRLICARRNPNLVLLTLSALIFMPHWGILAIGLWTAITLVIHGARLIAAFMHRQRGGSFTSWLAEQ